MQIGRNHKVIIVVESQIIENTANTNFEFVESAH